MWRNENVICFLSDSDENIFVFVYYFLSLHCKIVLTFMNSRLENGMGT